MKRLMNKILVSILTVAVIVSCTDDSLDPFRLKDIKKASILVLRGDALANLLDSGCAGFFIKNAPSGFTGEEQIVIETDFLSENQDLLESVDVFVRTLDIPRAPLFNVPGSEFTIPTDGQYRKGTVTVDLADIKAALEVDDAYLATLTEFSMVIEMDVNLTDGTTVLADALDNGGLYESVQYYPSQRTTYCAKDVSEFLPVATLSLSDDKPLLDGESVTVNIDFDIPIDTPPTVEIDGVPVTVTEVSSTEFTVEYTATNITRALEVSVSGALAGGDPPIFGLEQEEATIDIVVDNTAPQVVSASTGDVIGKDQFVIIEVEFNEPISDESDFTISVVDPNGKLEDMIDEPLEISGDGLTASATFVFKLVNIADPAIHDDLDITFSGGTDLAGNAVPLADIDGIPLVIDVGTPPAPVVTLDGVDYDLGDQIKWTITQTDGGDNPGGSTTGTFYFVAIDAGEAGPHPTTGFTPNSDGTVTWTMATDATPPAGAPAGTKVVNRQTGSVQVTGGTSGTTWTTFTANSGVGGFDIYGVFVSSSGTVSEVALVEAGVDMN